jgi:Fe-S cluster assembly scaffold protein SufB
VKNFLLLSEVLQSDGHCYCGKDALIRDNLGEFANFSMEIGPNVHVEFSFEASLRENSGQWTRNMQFTLAGQGGCLAIRGSIILRGTQSAKLTCTQMHREKNTTSHVTIKSLLRGKSRGSIGSTIAISRDAFRSEATFKNHSLLLSPTAAMAVNPSLEIHCNDARCTHSATISGIDESQKMYLRTRGIAPAKAKSLLASAFFCDFSV